MELSDPIVATSGGGADRRIPTWAAGLLAQLAREAPRVLTRDDIATLLAELGSDRNIDRTVAELRRLGWLVPLRILGVWAFLPPGQDRVVDPYIELRAWRARNPDLVLRLAGEAAAWHLGYLDRAPDGPVAVWVPSETRLPDGLRGVVSVVRLRWSAENDAKLGPSPAMLRHRRLDLLTWAGGLPGFGPEALLIQLAARPGSFDHWADLVGHLGEVAEDCELDRLFDLLHVQTASTWQRAAYLLDVGGNPSKGKELLDHHPHVAMPTAVLDRGAHRRRDAGEERGIWIPQYQVLDRLVAPLQPKLGKS